MPVTNFPNGVSSWGMPVGMAGMVPNAKVLFVDPTNGNNGYEGTDAAYPLKTITSAVGQCKNDRGDTIVVLPGTVTENVVINKSKVRLVGFCAGLGGPYMSRINPVAGCTTATILVQARDVEIANLQIAGNHDAASKTPSIFLDGENGGTRAYIHDCTIEQLTPTVSAYCNGIDVYGDRHTIERVLFDSCNFGIYVNSGPTVTTYETLIQDCIFRACNVGIDLHGENVTTGQVGATVIRCFLNGTGAYAQSTGIMGAAQADLVADCRIGGYSTTISGPTVLSQNYNGATGGVLIT